MTLDHTAMDPQDLKPSLTNADGTGLKASLTESSYSGVGVPASRYDLNASIIDYETGFLKASLTTVDGNSLKASIAKIPPDSGGGGDPTITGVVDDVADNVLDDVLD